jgi:arsenate reductase
MGRVYNVLFLCTGNSARSVMAEVMLDHLGRGRFKAFSAGSHPTGKVNPFAIETMEAAGLPTAGLRSKAWEEFAGAGSPQMDFILTVCDDAAAGACPAWPGQPATANWGVADPAAVEGSDDSKREAFRSAAAILKRRIELLVALPDARLAQLSAQSQLRQIGTSR